MLVVGGEEEEVQEGEKERVEGCGEGVGGREEGWR